MAKLSRRTMIIGVGGASLTTAIPAAGAIGQEHAPTGRAPAPMVSGPFKSNNYMFLQREEAAFIEAAVARLIPADELGAGALEAGVPSFIDKQLGGAWGAGERLYRSGPWQPGTAAQGYQLPFTPAELFRTAIAAINGALAKAADPFEKMSVDRQDAYLRGLEQGKEDLDGVPSRIFFDSLWKITVEGFFCDPVYGGNRGMVAWRMIGFPGAYASYYDLVDRHGIKVDRPPLSLAEDAHGGVHLNPNIPAYSPPTNR